MTGGVLNTEDPSVQDQWTAGNTAHDFKPDYNLDLTMMADFQDHEAQFFSSGTIGTRHVAASLRTVGINQKHLESVKYEDDHVV